jgi:acyl dehydratase
MERQTFEDIEVGTEYTSPGRTVTEADVVLFAGLSGDYTELHTNAEFMRDHPFGQRIAHGLLGLAIASGLAARTLPPTAIVGFLGLNNWNFRKPIFIGDTVYLHIVVHSKRLSNSQPNRGVVTYRRSLVNQRNEVVQDGEMANLVECRG